MDPGEREKSPRSGGGSAEPTRVDFDFGEKAKGKALTQCGISKVLSGSWIREEGERENPKKWMNLAT